MPMTKTETEEKLASLEMQIAEFRKLMDGTNQDMQNSVRKFKNELEQTLSLARPLFILVFNSYVHSFS